VLNLYPRQQNSAYLILYALVCRLRVFLLMGNAIAKMITIPKFHNFEPESLWRRNETCPEPIPF